MSDNKQIQVLVPQSNTETDEQKRVKHRLEEMMEQKLLRAERNDT